MADPTPPVPTTRTARAFEGESLALDAPHETGTVE
jgi:hypothetical protein